MSFDMTRYDFAFC